jgi:long-subunit fatty acid transport protein
MIGTAKGQVKPRDSALPRVFVGSHEGLARSMAAMQRSIRIHRAVLCSALALAALLYPTRSLQAAPFLSGRTGGLSLIGPAAPHPASMHVNPAALGLLGGGHVSLASVASLQHASVRRQTIDPASGAPRFDGTLTDSSALDLTNENYVGATTGLGTDYLVIGLAVYNTWDSTSYRKGGGGAYLDGAIQDIATRYHGASLTFANLFATVAATVRVSERIHVGLSIGYVHGWVDYQFVRDVALDGGTVLDAGESTALDSPCPDGPCGYENDWAAEGVYATGESDGLDFGAGVLIRLTDRIDFGLGYRSAIVSLGGERISAEDTVHVGRAGLTRELTADETKLSDGPTGRSKIIYRLPHTVGAGVWWRARTDLAFDFQLRWQTFRLHDVLDLRLTGAALRASPRIPDRIVHYRGFQDVISGQFGVQWDPLPRLRIQAATMLSNSAVPGAAVTGTSIDNWNVDALLALRWRATPDLTLGIGYGLVWVPKVEVTDSVFDPSDLARCVDGSFDIELDECRDASGGRGLAAAAGSYSRMQQRLGLSLDYAWR